MDKNLTQAEFFKALSHPTRLQILDMIRERGELCVCEIIPAMDVEQSTLSRHLTMLKRAGIVSAKKDAQRVIYRVSDPKISDLLRLASELTAE